MQQQLQHTVCHSVGVSRYKTSNLQILSFLFLLSSFFSTAQPYQWQWAVNGGSNALSWAGASWNCYVEQVHDIAIDKNNNYYFLAKIKNGNPLLNGQPVTVYGNPQGGNDIFIFSTTSNGTVRWSQAIGGGGLFVAPDKMALERRDNLCVAVNLYLPN